MSSIDFLDKSIATFFSKFGGTFFRKSLRQHIAINLQSDSAILFNIGLIMK